MFTFILALSTLSFGKIVEYQLSKNYGQVFVDYSGNNNHGVNGDSHTTVSKDTMPSDRGAYYTNSQIAITTPYNTLVNTELTLTQPFTLLCWINVKDKDGVIFDRYKNGDRTKDYITVKRFRTNKNIYIEGAQSGVFKSYTGINNSFNQNEWKMISLVALGKAIKGYVDNKLEVSFNFDSNYIETGSYTMTIGSTSDLAFEGFLWYFVILDNDSTGQSGYIGGLSTKCLTTSCHNCNPSVKDPFLGTGCISLVNKINQDAGAKACSASTLYGCSNSGLLDCSSCTCGSCLQSGTTNNCWCPSGCTVTTTTCVCPSAVAGWLQCCDTSCKVCDSNIGTICISCVAIYASPDGSLGCKCNAGYYGTKPLSTAAACLRCYSECATCDSANKCLTCVSSNSSPDSTIGCKCNSKYYGTKPLITSASCLDCYIECATCNRANKCLTCVSSNASPSSLVGCTCDAGYYGTNPLNSANSCIKCHIHCATCNQANICLTCISSNASPSTTAGCICKNYYFAASSLTDANACQSCYQDCATCNNANTCLTCISLNAEPDPTLGCNCLSNAYGTKPLTLSTSCQLCYYECATCSSATSCVTCISSNATPDSSIGCNCNSGYYGTKPLIAANSCNSCYQECKTCAEANKCLTCISLYSTPDPNIGCVCEPLYFAILPLITATSCRICSNECSSCNSNYICNSCLASNASPDSYIGCNCYIGYYPQRPLLTSSSCVKCDEECATCEKADICLSCLSSNSTPNEIKGCDCIDGYYPEEPLTSENSCHQCYSHCLTCVEDYKCKTCISINATPNNTIGCYCKDGYYLDGSLTQANSCKACNTECKTCQSADLCLTCKSENAIPNLVSGCDCKEGYFNSITGNCEICIENCKVCENNFECITCYDENASFTGDGCGCNSEYYAETKSPLKCSPCSPNCTVCKDYFNCLTCKFDYANKLSDGCECPLYSSEINGTCECDSSYFMAKNSEGVFKCSLCHSSCETCEGSSKYSCKECKGDLQMSDQDNTCSLCPDGKYNNNSVCSDCFKDCSTCSDYQFCLTCKNEKKEANPTTGICETVCDVGEVSVNDICKKCPTLCDVCDIQKNCISCTENAEFFGSQCKCKKGFKVSQKTCVAKYFTGDLSISSKNYLKLEFSKRTEKKLRSNDFEISIESNVGFTWDLIVRNNQTYKFIMKFNGSIGSGVTVYLKVLGDIVYSSDNSQLIKYFYSGNLNQDIIPQSIVVISQLTGAAGKIIISSSIGIGLLLNPATGWALVNTIQLIAYIPLNSNPLTPSIVAFLTSLGGFNPTPNPMSYIFSSTTTSPPYKEASNYGFNSSVFWVNIGQTISILLTFILLYPFILVFSKLNMGKFSKRFVQIAGNYKYNMFIRFWMQSYLDYGIFGLIQLKSVRFMQPVNSFGIGYFHLVSASFVIILFFLTPPYILLCSYLSYKKMIDKENLEFKKKFGSVFDEFKNDKGFLSTQYYFVYFARRLAYVLSQVYLNEYPYIQNGLNIGFSILQTGFLLYFRPFKDFTSLLSNCVGEICVVIVFSLSVFFLHDLGQGLSDILEKTVIFTVIVGIGAQFFISIYLFFVSVKSLCLKIEKNRAIYLLKSINK